MTNILDRFIAKEQLAFRPQTRSQLVALRLAQKLGEPQSTQHYAALAEQYSESQLLTAFRRTMRSGENGDLAERFHVELQNLNVNASNGQCENLLAVRVERRSIAVAVFKGEHLEHTDLRQLSSDRSKAMSSALGFVNWVTDQYPPDSVAMERMNVKEEIQRQALDQAIKKTLDERGLPVWRMAKSELFFSFGHPGLRSRKELRAVITNIWPILASVKGRDLICDAVAIALHVELERLFVH